MTQSHIYISVLHTVLDTNKIKLWRKRREQQNIQRLHSEREGKKTYEYYRGFQF